MESVKDLLTFDLEDLEDPTLDALQQIDADELLTEDDLGGYMDDVLTGGMDWFIF